MLTVVYGFGWAGLLVHLVRVGPPSGLNHTEPIAVQLRDLAETHVVTNTRKLLLIRYMYMTFVRILILK